MKRSPVVRIQALLLVAVCGLVVWRATSGPDAPAGTITITGLEPGEFDSAFFSLGNAGRIRVEASGSLESGAGALAAYPWIVRTDDRSTVWRLDPAAPRDGRFLVRGVDTLSLEPGSYEMYFATFGSTGESRSGGGFLGLRPHWTNDAGDWKAVVVPIDPVRLEPVSKPAEQAAPILRLDRRDRSRDRLLVASGDAVALVEAVASICERSCDRVAIEDAISGEVAWTMGLENTAPAGGAARNRRFRDEVALPGGVYRVVFETASWHSFGRWSANPPMDPSSWGLRILPGSVGITPFDPWSDREPLVAMLRVGDDQLLRAVVQVSRPTRVYVDATGELMEGGSRFDYAWIERGDGRERVWEQNTPTSVPAGGDSDNRRSVAFLTLEPGRYSVYYQSDGSHAYGSFNRSEPDHPERWGVALFPVDTAAVGSSIRLVEGPLDAHEAASVAPGPPPVSGAPVPPIPPVTGESLFSAVGVGNDRQVEGTFELARTTRVRIVALGELTRGGRYDYGWIETGEAGIAWEMSMNNTAPAGGDDRNRMFDGVITLQAGTYTAHYQTDFSHAYGDFDSGAPSDPGAWGMRIVRMPE